MKADKNFNFSFDKLIIIIIMKAFVRKIRNVSNSKIRGVHTEDFFTCLLTNSINRRLKYKDLTLVTLIPIRTNLSSLSTLTK